MYNKFDHIWSKLEIIDKSVIMSCEEKLKKFSWLIYIVAKQQIFESQGTHNLPEFAFLILATLQLVVINANPKEVEIGILN